MKENPKPGLQCTLNTCNCGTQATDTGFKFSAYLRNTVKPWLKKRHYIIILNLKAAKTDWCSCVAGILSKRSTIVTGDGIPWSTKEASLMCTGSKHVEQCFNTWWFDGQWTEASVQKMGKFLLGSNGRQHVTVWGSTRTPLTCGLSAPAPQLPSTTLTTKMPLRTSKVPPEEWQLIYERGSNVHRTWKGPDHARDTQKHITVCYGGR